MRTCSAAHGRWAHLQWPAAHAAAHAAATLLPTLPDGCLPATESLPALFARPRPHPSRPGESQKAVAAFAVHAAAPSRGGAHASHWPRALLAHLPCWLSTGGLTTPGLARQRVERDGRAAAAGVQAQAPHARAAGGGREERSRGAQNAGQGRAEATGCAGRGSGLARSGLSWCTGRFCGAAWRRRPPCQCPPGARRSGRPSPTPGPARRPP